MRIRSYTLLVAVCALAVPMFAASPVKPGKWQVTMEMEMPGMAMKMPPTTITHCITKEDAENPEATLPKTSKDGKCKISDYKMDGNTVSWSMTCEGKEPMTGSGKITYTGDSYDGSMKMKIGDHEMNAHYTGKRIGDCD